MAVPQGPDAEAAIKEDEDEETHAVDWAQVSIVLSVNPRSEIVEWYRNGALPAAANRLAPGRDNLGDVQHTHEKPRLTNVSRMWSSSNHQGTP